VPLVDAGTWVFAVVAALNVALGLAYYVRWAGLLVMRPATEPPTWRVQRGRGAGAGRCRRGLPGAVRGGPGDRGAVPGVLR
jgi:NADH-quinone oxidoreductase subunit N